MIVICLWISLCVICGWSWLKFCLKFLLKNTFIIIIIIITVISLLSSEGIDTQYCYFKLNKLKDENTAGCPLIAYLSKFVWNYLNNIFSTKTKVTCHFSNRNPKLAIHLICLNDNHQTECNYLFLLISIDVFFPGMQL